MRYLVLISILTGFTWSSFAQNMLTDEEIALGFELLFDGNNIESGSGAWRKTNPDHAFDWRVVDGALTRPEGKRGKDIYLERYFDDFELRLEYKADGNSGVFYNLEQKNDESVSILSGQEFAIQSVSNNKYKPPEESSGALYDVFSSLPESFSDPDVYHSIRIICLGDSVWHFIDEETKPELNPVVHYVIGSPAWDSAKSNSKFGSKNNWPPDSGFIGFQDKGNSVFFKNIRIRALFPGDEIQVSPRQPTNVIIQPPPALKQNWFGEFGKTLKINGRRKVWNEYDE